jgi:transcriptional regulator with XRE-family HTH domain
MDINKMRRLLVDRRLDIVSDATGVHVNTISRIRDGKTENPSYKAFEALRKYLEDDQ